MTDCSRAVDGARALGDHAAEVGRGIHARYGPCIDIETLGHLLEDRQSVRFPVTLEFSEAIEANLFAVTEPLGETPADGYTITLHAHFAGRDEEIVPLVLYHLVAVNYGDFATSRDAESFGAACLGLDPEDYYQLICRLADSIPVAA